MKKLVLFFAVAFVASFASCGSKTASETEAVDSTVTVVETVVVDSVNADTTVAVAAEAIM